MERLDIVYQHCPRTDFNGLWHGINRIIFRPDLFDLAFIKINFICIFQEYSQFFVVETLCVDLTIIQGCKCVTNLIFQLPLVTFIKNQIIIWRNNRISVTQIFQIVQPVVKHFHTRLQLFFIEQTALKRTPQIFQFLIFTVQILIIIDRPLNLYDIC